MQIKFLPLNNIYTQKQDLTHKSLPLKSGSSSISIREKIRYSKKLPPLYGLLEYITGTTFAWTPVPMPTSVKWLEYGASASQNQHQEPIS